MLSRIYLTNIQAYRFARICTLVFKNEKKSIKYQKKIKQKENGKSKKLNL